MTDDTYPDPIPAATLVIFRESVDGPELLMVERARAMAFAGGALVFPGGRIDPADYEIAAAMGSDTDELAARVAAVRETIEEAGLPIGLSALPDERALGAIRAGLHAGERLDMLLGAHGLALDLDPLVPFARWRPLHRHMRIFDTRFYLARLPMGAPAPIVDATENVRVFWQSARGVLDDADRGAARIIFPTRRNLERLAQFATFDEAAAHAARYPVRTITPWIEPRDGGDHLCIPDDLGYPVTSEPMNSADRA